MSTYLYKRIHVNRNKLPLGSQMLKGKRYVSLWKYSSTSFTPCKETVGHLLDLLSHSLYHLSF